MLLQPIISSFVKTRNFVLVRPKGTGKLLILFHTPLETKAAAGLLAGELVIKVIAITIASVF